MKKLFTLMSVAAIALSIPAGAFAAEKKAKAAATPAAPAATPAAAVTPAAAKPLPMDSVVTTIDTAGKTFTHKNKDGKEVKFVVTPQTVIENGAKFEDIKVGDRVDGLRLKKSDTEYEIVKITKFGVPAPKAPKAPKATPKP